MMLWLAKTDGRQFFTPYCSSKLGNQCQKSQKDCISQLFQQEQQRHQNCLDNRVGLTTANPVILNVSVTLIYNQKRQDLHCGAPFAILPYKIQLIRMDDGQQ